MRHKLLFILPLLSLIIISSALAMSEPTDVFPEDGALYLKTEDVTISSSVPDEAEMVFVRWLSLSPTGNPGDDMTIIGDKATVTFQDLPTGIYTFKVGASKGQIIAYSTPHTITVKNIFDNAANMMQTYLDGEEEAAAAEDKKSSQDNLLLKIVLGLIVVGYFWSKR